ncbi:uncharacterized protein N7511_011053 [Penicillium nucicola]|uniref:uncharacterized protein n=1 Tax=Penicillium nucicola TaxID=1850975 RepID=UPI002544E213|nr:uncharacterized protein N7511_011053 [Penicillium nucicola]KAJ5749357.1 hypothetical protein N7511_011053 [Penicillium nucicola]
MASSSRRRLHHSNLRSIQLRKPVAMAASGTPIKRSSSTDQYSVKRLKHYHHHHRLQEPVTLPSPEPAVQDEAHVDQLMNRAIGISLKDAGYYLAEPTALSSFRSATEEYMLRLSTFARQSMLSCRRTQPIPQDFEHALTRLRLTPDDLLPTLKCSQYSTPAPPLLHSSETEGAEDVLPPSLPLLTALSSEDDRANRSYIPKHFPSFPSKHTYSATAVFVERDGDQRKIRERAAEDGRHGEEALRKLASAAFRDNQTGSTGHQKKLWGRRADSMETMFEKTTKALTKKLNQDPRTSSAAAALIDSAMDIDSGNPDADKARTKLLWNMEMGPIVNCERDLWRRTASTTRRGEENDQKPSASAEPLEVMTGM